jgi:integrase
VYSIYGAVVSNKKKRRPILPCLLTAHQVGCAHFYHRKPLKEIPYIEKCSEKENAPQGFFEDADFERIASCLPEGLKDFVWFGYLTGWCKGEVSHLEWRHVEDDTLRLPPHMLKHKNGRMLIIEGNPLKGLHGGTP